MTDLWIHKGSYYERQGCDALTDATIRQTPDGQWEWWGSTFEFASGGVAATLEEAKAAADLWLANPRP